MEYQFLNLVNIQGEDFARSDSNESNNKRDTYSLSLSLSIESAQTGQV